MLILTRKIGESLIIQDGIRIRVLGLRGKQVRLGIEAPEDVVILREEVHRRIAQENLEAATFELSDLEVLVCSAREAVEGGPGLPPALMIPAGEARLPVASQHLGQVQVAPEHIFAFSPWLAGFSQCQRFALVHHPRLSPFLWLQSLEDPALALVAVEGGSLETWFGVRSGEPAWKDLAGESPEDLLVLVIVTVPAGRPLKATVNLGAPLLLNRKTQKARQVVRENSQPSLKPQVLPKAE